MSKLIQPQLPSRKGVNDPRSTGGAAPVRSPDILALRGTIKGRT